MKIQVLAATADSAERRILRRLLRDRPGDPDRISLRFSGGDDGRMHEHAGAVPDVVLLNMALVGDQRDSEAIVALFSNAPIILLVAVVRRIDDDAGVQVVLEQASRQLFRELIRVTATPRPARAPPVLARTHGVIVLEAIADAVVSTDAEGRIVYCNPAAERLLCLEQRHAVGMAITATMLLQEPDTLRPIPHPVLGALATGQTIRMPSGALLVRPDGSEIVIDDSTAPIVAPDGKRTGAVMVFHDITEASHLQAQVDYLAWHDFLTGLPNRFAAQRRLNQMLAQASETPTELAVMYLDLDRFKAVNDTLGHAAGDALLVSVAARLRACFRSVDLISRQGGDEFVVLMAPGTGAEDAVRAAERTLEAVAQPHPIDGEQVHVGCSIGIALYPRHGRGADTLLRHADTALHSAKAAGRNGWCFFRSALLTGAVQRRQMEDGIRGSLEQGDFRLFYQPKFGLADRALGGCEALLRWRHAEWGWVSPARFVRTAEESGLIVPLGKWVLEEAIRQASLWDGDGRQRTTIAINVSALELQDADLPDRIARQMDVARLDPARLQLELTESSLMRDMRSSALMLRRLKDTGLSIAIDDFGTGYSSLGYLAELPIDLVKIDRSFVHGIDSAGPRKQALLRAVLTLARNIDLPAVAEGIETEPEMRFLTDAGCPLGQGFYLGAARPAGEFAADFLGGA